MSQIRGIMPVVVTSYHDDDAVDYRGYEHQVEWLIRQGVSGLGFGYGSEIHRLTMAERLSALDVVAASASGRVPVFASAGANSTAAAVATASAAAEAGADIVMVPAPSLPNISSADILRHYVALSNDVALPIIVQDAPDHTGVHMSPDLLIELAGTVDMVQSIKIESNPSAPMISMIASSCNALGVTVLGGAGGSDFIHELQRGAAGSIPGPAFVGVFVDVWRLQEEGQVDQARALFYRLLPLLTMSRRTLDTFLYVQKEILRRDGILSSARVRTPTEAHSDQLDVEISGLLADLVDLT